MRTIAGQLRCLRPNPSQYTKKPCQPAHMSPRSWPAALNVMLAALRVYWRGLRRKPTNWLFPGNRWHTASYPVSTKVLDSLSGRMDRKNQHLGALDEEQALSLRLELSSWGQGDSRGLFIQVVILVVLGALQRELESQAILCHLIYPNFRGNLYRSRISSTRFASLGCSIRLS